MADSDGLLKGVVKTLEEGLDALRADEAKALKLYTETKAERKRVEATVVMLTGKKRKTTPSKSGHIKPRTADAILEFMKDSDDDWTASRLSEGLEIHSSTVSKSLNWLRENNLIRATRTVRGGGHAYAPWTE